jgi:hypothetical protein
MFKPLEVFNDIVSGIILGLYDISVLLAGPLLAPLWKRRVSIWRTILATEARLNSLTLTFILIAGIVTIYTPTFLKALIQDPPTSSTATGRFTFVLVLSVLLTILFDLLLRSFILARAFILKVAFSHIRLAVLRLHFCLILFAVLLSGLASFGAQYNAEYPELYVPQKWLSAFTSIAPAIAALPFTFSLMHLTYRLRGPVGWLFAFPFSYSFVNVTLAIGTYSGIVLFAVLAIFFGVDDNSARLYEFNTACAMKDDTTVFVESDLLMKSDRFDAVEPAEGSFFASLSNQIIPIKPEPQASVVLVNGKVVRTKWSGKLLVDTQKPDIQGTNLPCSLTTYGLFWTGPKRVQVLTD